MYSESLKKGVCVNCKEKFSHCKCPDMCKKCCFYKQSSCHNEKSGNFRITMKYDDHCSKFKKRPALIDRVNRGSWF